MEIRSPVYVSDVQREQLPYLEREPTMWMIDIVKARRASEIGALLLVLLATGGPAFGADPIQVATLIPYADKAEIRDSIREECGLGSKLSKSLVNRGAKKELPLVRVGNPVADLEAETSSRRSLELRITDAIQTSGGLFPTHSLSIDGVLKEDGRIVGTMEGTRFAQASFFPFRRGECSILSEAVRLLAKDVIKWVKKPKLEARLGDAR